MPSTKRGDSAAPPTLYRATGPAPKQARFPGRKRQTRTYGKTTNRSLKQDTLTQMEFVGTPAGSALELLVDSQEDDDGLDENDDETENFIELEQLPVAATRQRRTEGKTEKKVRANRRKTAGESLEAAPARGQNSKRRKTLGDTPTGSSTSSSFHTQTLTQFLSNQDPDEVLEHDWHVTDSEAGGDIGFVLETPRKNKDVPTTAAEKELDVTIVPDVDSTKLVTPCGRDRMMEIPSSQSPLTPMLLRYSPAGPRESPLKRKSSPLRRQTTPALKSARKTPRLQVEDTFASSPTTPTARSVAVTPKAGTGKRLRFDFDVDKENITPGRKKPKSPKLPRDTSGRKPLREVPDSDDDDLDDTTDEAESVTGNDQDRGRRDETPCPVVDDDSDATADPESCYGDIGAETQAQILSSSSHVLGNDSPQRPKTTARRRPQPTTRSSPRASQTSQSSVRSTRRSKAQTSKRKDPEETVKDTETQFTPYTQGMESQRVPLDDIRALGPQTDRSDIMVSLHPEPLRQITEGTKNHEFRAWKIPPEVSRVWLYATNPHSELRYMCILGPPKVPGEIEDEKGLGNAEFNNGGKRFAKYAYEFIQVYELNNPVPLAEMIRKGWIKGAPQKYAFVPPAVVGELTANLRCALFGDEDTQYPCFQNSSPQLTESQELKAQLQSEGHYSTQSLSSEHNQPQDVVREHLPSLNEDQENVFARPAVPSDKIDSDVQTPRPSRVRYGGSSSVVRTSQATTISQVSSSPAVSPVRPQLRRRTRRSTSHSQTVIKATESTIVEIVSSSSPILPPRINSDPLENERDLRDIIPREPLSTQDDQRLAEDEGEVGLGETQSCPSSSSAVHFRSTGELLPESLLCIDDDDGPPPIIWDSADESD